MSTKAPSRPPHLLHFRVSHYNEKVRWALDYKGWPHTREALLPGLHIPRVRMLTGQNQTPVVVFDGEPMCGSAKILEEIERRRPDPPLFPSDPENKKRASELEAYFDTEVAPALRRLFWSTYLDRPADCARMAADGFGGAARGLFRVMLPIARPIFRRNMGITNEKLVLARERLQTYLDRIEAEVGSSGYIVGDRFTVADLAVAAVMTAILRPPEFAYPIPEPWPPALVELRSSIANHPGARWVADIYKRHRGTSSEISALAKRS